MEEIWKDIKGYEGDYQVSNLGNVKSLKFNMEKILKQTKHTNGYLKINLTKNNNQKMFLIHRLLAQVFLGLDFDSDLMVNHKNHIKDDNNVNNLEIVSRRENLSYQKRKTTSKYAGVYYDKIRRNKWVSGIVVNKKRKHLGYFETEEQAHQAYLEALVKYDISNKYSKRIKETI